RGERALRDLPALVERLAVLDAGDEVDVLLDVRVLGGFLVLVGLRALDPAVRAVRVGHAARAHDALRDVLRGPRGLPAHAQDARAVRVLVLHREVVEDVPVLGIGPGLAPAHARALHRTRA